MTTRRTTYHLTMLLYALSATLPVLAGVSNITQHTYHTTVTNAIAAAVSGDTLVVGANLEDSNATGVNGNPSNNSATDSGHGQRAGIKGT